VSDVPSYLITSGPLLLSILPLSVSRSSPSPRKLITIFCWSQADKSDPLPHTHIQFAHCYKQQGGWADVLRRFAEGKGTLYDLEFLEDPESRRRVAAFGFHAGFAGAAAGALAFAKQQEEGGKGVLKGLKPYANETKMVDHVKQALESVEGGVENVKVLVIGALGRCGSGAVDLFRKAGLKE